MILQNSYIFLSKVEDEKKPINIEPSIISLLNNNLGTSLEEIDLFGYYKKEFQGEMTIKEISFQVEFVINKVARNTYLDVNVSHDNKESIITGLEYINDILTNIDGDFEKHYIVITSYDSISEYYCNRIYSRFNKLERKLRKLLFNTYILNFDKDYYTQTIEPEFQNRIKERIGAKGGRKKKSIERLKMFFYSLDYSDIQELLFSERWTKVDEQYKLDYLKKHDNLSDLKDEELREAFKNISPRSDWDRFFSTKITDLNIEESIEGLRKSRNDIAHFKFFLRDEYEFCKKEIDKLNESIDIAIKITEEEDFLTKNKEAMRETWNDFTVKMDKFAKKIGEMTLPLAEMLGEVSRKMGSLLTIDTHNGGADDNTDNDDMANDD